MALVLAIKNVLTLHLEKSILMVDANSKHNFKSHFAMCRIMYKTLENFFCDVSKWISFPAICVHRLIALAVHTYTASILHLIRAYTVPVKEPLKKQGQTFL